MENIVIFGGTTEGRQLVERLAVDNKLHIYVCVATEYGATLLPDSTGIEVVVGRMDQTEMKGFLQAKRPVCCVDATHPYAVEVSHNIFKACEDLSVQYLRILREEEDLFMGSDTVNKNSQCLTPCVFTCASVDETVDLLRDTEGVIFVSTGSKELEKYTRLEDYRSRIVARVLPSPEVLDKCRELGFEQQQIIGKQGPFSEEDNYEMFTKCNAKWLVTKSSGKAGGYLEKCEAALRADMKIIVIGRPEEVVKDTLDVDAAMEMIRQEFTS